MKKLLIHDLENDIAEKVLKQYDDYEIISATKKAACCTGCFGCWLKSPGTCVMKDGFENIGVKLACSDYVVIISRNLYGGFSPSIKNTLDRSISGVLPFFSERNGEMHHKVRYKKLTSLTVYFYQADSLTLEERELAEKIVQANSVNFNTSAHKTIFINNILELEGCCE